MLRFDVGAEDLLRSRFALSPVMELHGLLRGLTGRSGHRLPASWSARLAPRLRSLRREVALDAVLALLPPRYGAGFVAPPPQGLTQTVEDDLASVRATPLAQARRDIRSCLARQSTVDAAVLAVLRSRDVVARLASTMEYAWHELLAPDWPQLRALCECDVLHRSAALGRAGWAAAFDGLRPHLRWRDGGIEIPRIARGQTIAVGGTGLLLIPSVFVRPGVAAYTDEPWPKAIVYPARGVQALWEPRAVAAPGALAELIGRARARLLVALAEPASTTHLARTLGLAVGAVGDHLRILTRAGLLDRARAGRSVLYRRTPLGEALIGTTRTGTIGR